MPDRQGRHLSRAVAVPRDRQARLRKNHRRDHPDHGQRGRPIKAILAPYNPVGTTAHVGFNTSKTERYETHPDKCHIDWVILDSGWEAEFCRVAEAHPRVLAYAKNHNLGFDVPYRLAG